MMKYAFFKKLYKISLFDEKKFLPIKTLSKKKWSADSRVYNCQDNNCNNDTFKGDDQSKYSLHMRCIELGMSFGVIVMAQLFAKKCALQLLWFSA